MYVYTLIYSWCLNIRGLLCCFWRWVRFIWQCISMGICMTLLFKRKLVFQLPGNCKKMCYFMLSILTLGLLDVYFVNVDFFLFYLSKFKHENTVKWWLFMIIVWNMFCWNCWMLNIMFLLISLLGVFFIMTEKIYIFQSVNMIYMYWLERFSHLFYLSGNPDYSHQMFVPLILLRWRK